MSTGIYDTVLRFTDLAALDTALPGRGPPSWFVDQFGWTVLGPQTVTPPVVATDPETGVVTYAYDSSAIELGVYVTITTKGIDDILLAMPEVMISRNRETGEIVAQHTINQVDLPIVISPTWAGMGSEFTVPAKK